MKIYLVRHGQTKWNALKKMQGSADIPLNENGIAQAKQTKLNLNDTKLDIIFCSPLIRAKQTAEIINEFFLSKSHTLVTVAARLGLFWQVLANVF